MMRVAAFSLAGIPTDDAGKYTAALAALFRELKIELAVLPAHTSFLLYGGRGAAGGGDYFAASFKQFMQASTEWNGSYLEMHRRLARENRLFLVAGTTVEEEGGRYYQTSYCFGPEGELCGRQRQTHLGREERALGLSRGEELHLFDLGGMKAGLLPGTDARHPEVGRILALEGAGLVLHSGALAAASEISAQAAGIWAQVQQNQFWAVEAQLGASLWGRSFGAPCAVMGPCEATSDHSGYLDRSGAEKSFALAELQEADRRRVIKDYPLLDFLNPGAYRGLLPELYR